MNTYRRLLAFLRPHRTKLIGNIVANVVASWLDVAAFALLIPFLNLLFKNQALPDRENPLARMLNALLGPIIDPSQPMKSLKGVIYVMLALVVAKNVFLWIGGQMGAALQERITRDIRDAVFRHMQRLPLGWFSRNKTGQIMARILADAEQAKAVIAEIATRSIQSATTVLATVITLFVMSPRLALISLVMAPLITAVIQPILRRLRAGHRRLRNDYGEITSVLQELVSGIRLVKSFRGEAYEDQRFTTASGGYTRGMVRITRISQLAGPLTEVLGTVVAMVILYLGARSVYAVPSTMNGGTLVAFMVLVMKLLPPLKQLSQAPTTAQLSLAAADRLFEVLDEPTEGQRDPGTRDTATLREGIVFEHVDFAYDGPRVLRDINISARRGDVIALVGPSGAGKSTLVDLIPRFIDPTGGRILLDGVDTRQIKLPALRALTGIVSQDTVLFNDTVRNNIAYGAAERFTAAQVEAAARAANAHAFITELPNG
ncbi:MAG TPA: ABC transporter ATP-binding protein, partial [Gemmatimonadaceae bacterium]|nr:ABC transporter ATP-binding protein [Gemmatimonadaceae bacterium]